MALLRARGRQRLLSPLERPLARLLLRLGVGPNALTLLGLGASAGAGALAGLGKGLPAGALLLLAGALDLLDGAVARLGGRVTPLGALLDSLADRLGEGALFLGLLFLYAPRGEVLPLVLLFLAFGGSFLVSYIRARAEGLGLSPQQGVMTRPERLLVLSIGLMAGYPTIALGVVAGLSLLTAGQRAVQAWRALRRP